MCLVSREIIDVLLENFDIDYVIKVQFKNDKFYSIKKKDVVVYKVDDFIKIKRAGIKNYDESNNINRGEAIIFCKDIVIDIGKLIIA